MAGRLTLVGGEFASLGFTEIGDERVGSLNNDQVFDADCRQNTLLTMQEVVM